MKYPGKLIGDHSFDVVENDNRLIRKYMFSQELHPDLASNFIIPCEFVFFEVGKDYEYPLHKHSYVSEFILSLNGNYSCSLNGHAVELSAGEGIMITCDDTHADTCQDSCNFLGVNFKVVDFLGVLYPKRLLGDDVSHESRKFKFKSHSEINLIIDMLMNRTDGDRAFIRQVDYSMAQVLIWHLLDMLYDKLSREFIELLFNNSFKQQLDCLFKQNLHMPLRVNDMADMLKVSRKTLEAQCTKCFGKSPAKTFMSKKMECASKLLLAGKNCNEISSRLGFNNQFQFSRAFKSHFKQSPSEYRLKNDESIPQPSHSHAKSGY